MERKELVGDDGLRYCSICGEKTEAIMDRPLFDGSGRKEKKKVHIMCKCRKAEMEKNEKLLKFEEEQQRIGALQSLNIMDKKLKGARFDGYGVTDDNRKAFAIAKKYVENFALMHQKGQGMMFYGNPGTGKSFTAAAIANELTDRFHTVVMTSFVKILQEYGHFDRKYDENIEKLNRAKLLILDDFGSERDTDYAVEKVYHVIDGRYRSGKPLIITTNIMFDEMKQCEDIRYKRIYDRLFEMCFPVKIDGFSWRKKEATARFDEMKKIMEG